MYRFLQTHGKKILAIFSAFLMISFALTGYYGRNSAGGKNAVIGTVGGEKIYQQDVYSARRAWDVLKSKPVGVPVSYAVWLVSETVAGVPRERADLSYQRLAAQIEAHPMLFFLLQKEAQRMGVSVNTDQLNELLENVTWLKDADPERNDAIRASVAQLMMVHRASKRATSPIKITQPMIEHELAKWGQQIHTDVAEFTSAQYKDRVPAPTAEQLKAQFEKFADVVRGPGDESNPFGFGYKYPDRLKLQYIGVRRDDLRKAAQDAKDAYQWEVEAQKFYIQHQNSFVRKEPPQTQPAATRAATSAPTTMPFTEVRETIKQRLIDDAADKKMTEVLDRITTVMQPDWTAYHKAAGAATRPTTAPDTIIGAPYDSFEYLQKLAQRVQKQTGVLPIVVSIADRWLGESDIAALPGLKDAVHEQMPLPAYLMNRSAAFITDPSKRTETGVLAELEPAKAMYDRGGNVYITRVTAAEPAHRPATLTEIENELRNDIITAKAYELAKADAQKLLADAQSTGSLQSAAASAGKKVTDAGPLSLGQMGQPIEPLALTGDAADRFRREAFELLETSTTKPSAKPTRLIELPRDGRLFASQLGNVEAQWTEANRSLQQFQLAQDLSALDAMRFERDWYNYDNAKARLNYIPDPAAGEQ